MSDADPELARLQLAEHLAHERFTRLSGGGYMTNYPEVVKAAKDLWTEAAAATLAHKRK